MRGSLILFFLAMSFTLMAQQSPNWLWSSMSLNGTNAAQHGLTQFAEGSMGFRRQWMGFSGAPTTVNGLVSMPFFGSKGDGAIFGAGLNLNVEKNGVFTFSSGLIEGAVNIKTNDENRLSMGIGLGFIQVGYDPAGVTTNQQDISISKFSSRGYPLLKLGIAYRTDQSISGVYVNDLVPGTWTNVGRESSLRTEWGIYYRYLVELNKDWFILPSLKLSKVFFTPLNYDISLRVNYNFKFHFWLGTQNINALNLGLGFRINEVFTVNYMFETMKSPVKSLNFNSHALGLKFILNKGGAMLRKQQLLMD